MPTAMRMFLLPVSTRRSLIYCERVGTKRAAGQKAPINERILTRASETWAKWEKAESGWQKQLTVYGNQVLKRIPFEEWGLKTIPPATKKRLAAIDAGQLSLRCLFPGAFLAESKVRGMLLRLATERQALHRRRMLYSFLLMPVAAPFALVPVIPNLPFFYLCFRAYSHYRALYGGKLLEHLISKDRVTVEDTLEMDEIYTAGLLYPTREVSRKAERPTPAQIDQVKKVIESQANNDTEEVMVLQKWNGKLIAESLKLPEMEIEIERAVEQVEKAIQKDHKELAGEKDEIMRVAVQKATVRNEEKK